MDRVTIACVQQRARLHQTIDEYREDLRRFLGVAQNKGSHLVLFPELAGVLVAPPLLRDVRSTLLIQADRGRRKEATLQQRITGALASRAAAWLRADLRANLRGLLAVNAQEIWNRYSNLFSELARQFQIVLVAPSAYLPDPVDGVVRNLAVVFGNDGAILGQQAKVILHPEDEGLAQAGAGWAPIATPVGMVGIMLGGDVLYPEVGRLLAYQGAESLLLLGACATPVLYQKLRAGILARMQDNQLYAAVSFVIGPHHLGNGHTPLVGRSAIFAPQELTPRLNGVLVEMGSNRSEGVLTAEWDFVALRTLWEESETPVRHQLPLAQAGQILARLYDHLKSLPRVHNPALLDQSEGSATLPVDEAQPTADRPLTLDELPVVSVVTRRWSGVQPVHPLQDSPLDLSELPEHLTGLPDEATLPRGDPDAHTRPYRSADDETDEMDALPENVPDKAE